MPGDQEVQQRLVAALQHMLESKKLSFHTDALGRRYVRVHAPIEGPFEFDVLHRELVDWLARFAVMQGLPLPRIAELKCVAVWLAGQAIGAPRKTGNEDLQLVELLDRELTIAAFYEWVRKEVPAEQELKIRAHDLWRKLKDQIEEQCKFSLPRRNFAGGPNVFMRKLNVHKQALLALKIYFEAARNNGCVLTIRRLDDADEESSAIASAAKSSAEGGCNKSDARTSRLETLKSIKGAHVNEE